MFKIMWGIQEIHLVTKRIQIADSSLKVELEPGHIPVLFTNASTASWDLLDSIQRDIFELLSSIQNDTSSPEARLAKMFHPGGPTITFSENGWHRSPDMQFTYPNREYASLIIEIAHSQREKSASLPKLAEEYIVYSGGNILLVPGWRRNSVPGSKDGNFFDVMPQIWDWWRNGISCEPALVVHGFVSSLLRAQVLANSLHYACHLV